MHSNLALRWTATQGAIYAREGNLGSSGRRLKELHKLRRTGNSISPFHVPAAYIALAEKDMDSTMNKYLKLEHPGD
jgi:hypothetical protein